jgi:ATP-dependent DNA helicase PIF1
MQVFDEPPPPYTLRDENVLSENSETLLNTEQSRVVEQVLGGRNVFITGSAGTGKSFIIQHLCKEFDRLGKVYRIVAPTGVAALNVGGLTIHRFLGITPFVTSIADYNKFCKKRSKVPWATLDVIIIDEVSMIHPVLFDLFDGIARLHKRSSLPFGGIQVILLGDYFQLCPIRQKDDKAGDPEYIFETPLWEAMRLEHHVLHQVMRQSEMEFIQALNDLRTGNFTNRVAKIVEKCTRNVREPGKHYVRLFPRNIDKNFANETEMAKLKGEERVFPSTDIGDARYLEGLRAEKELVLKVGCPVMLLWNMPEEGLCNGSLGILEEYDIVGLPVVRFNNGVKISVKKQVWEIKEKNRYGVHILAARTQIPLTVAFSLTVHKSQGLTIDHLEADCKGIFTSGQLYVMLSRASSSEGLIIINFDADGIMVDEKVIEFYEKLQ